MVPYLQIDGLTKSFGDLVLFNQISFGVAEGQRIGLIAKNGSGKTTLLNIIAGKEGYDEGSIVFRRDLCVGYLEQDPHYPEELTVLEACFHHGNTTVQLIKEYERCMETEGNPGMEDLLARMEHEKAWDYERKAKQILSQLKIRDFNQQVKHLSGGQLKRVALANVLITEPDFLILDEPTSGADPQERIRIRGLIARATQNHIVLLATHVVSDVECIANQVLLMNSGTLLKSGTPEELIASIETKVAQRFCTPEEIELYQHQHSVSLLFQRQGGQLLRLVGDDLPAEFEPAAGIGLEEVYLYYCAGNKAINTCLLYTSPSPRD